MGGVAAAAVMAASVVPESDRYRSLRRQRRSRPCLRSPRGRAGRGGDRPRPRLGTAWVPLTGSSPSVQHPQGRVAAERHGPGPVSAAPLPPSAKAAPEGWRGGRRRGGGSPLGARWEPAVAKVGRQRRAAWRQRRGGPAGASAAFLGGEAAGAGPRRAVAVSPKNSGVPAAAPLAPSVRRRGQPGLPCCGTAGPGRAGSSCGSAASVRAPRSPLRGLEAALRCARGQSLPL